MDRYFQDGMSVGRAWALDLTWAWDQLICFIRKAHWNSTIARKLDSYDDASNVAFVWQRISDISKRQIDILKMRKTSASSF